LFADVPNTELQLPLLNIEDADEDLASAGSRQSRRPSRQAAADTALVAGGGTTPTEGGVVSMTECVTELAAETLAKLEPDIVDAQLIEVVVKFIGMNLMQRFFPRKMQIFHFSMTEKFASIHWCLIYVFK
jgi:hypothetical protein